MKKLIFSILCFCFFICNLNSVYAESSDNINSDTTNVFIADDERIVATNLDLLSFDQYVYLSKNYKDYLGSNSAILYYSNNSSWDDLFLSNNLTFTTNSQGQIEMTGKWTRISRSGQVSLQETKFVDNGITFIYSLKRNNSVFYDFNKFIPLLNKNDPNKFIMTYTNYITDYNYTCNQESFTENGKPTSYLTVVSYTDNIKVTGNNMTVWMNQRLLASNVTTYEFNFLVYRESSSQVSCSTISKPSETTQTFNMDLGHCLIVTNNDVKYSFCPQKNNDLIVSAPNTDNKLDSTNNKLDGLIGLISNGNSSSNSTTNSNNQSNNKLDSTVNNFDNVENQYNNNLKNELSKIDPTMFTPNSTKFLDAMNFVKVNFDTMIKNRGGNSYNPFGVTIGFSLMLGLALLIIRKRL